MKSRIRVLVFLFLSCIILPACAAPPAPTTTPTVFRFATLIPKTAEPLQTSIQVSKTVAASPTISVIQSMVSPQDGMVLVFVPAGEFSMGSSDIFPKIEQPVHLVTLAAFWIDQTEVSNVQYGNCVEAGACALPKFNRFADLALRAHPVVWVSWFDAESYCAWVGRRLPTEAEWEKAARGTDGRIYPWGTWEINSKLLSYGGAQTKPVGSYPAGASPYGALDMAGNVGEWTADWYGAEYYGASPALNPTGPESGQEKINRGGGWYTAAHTQRSTYRYGNLPDYSSYDLGFRCALSEH